GANTLIIGTVYADDTGNCVQFSEVKSFNHDLSGLVCISEGNPSPRGVVDLGGTTAAEVNNPLGGTLDFSKIKIKAPNAKIGVVVRTRNAAIGGGERNIDLSFSKLFTNSDSDSLAYNIRDSSGAKNFDLVDASGAIFNAANRTVLNYNQYYSEESKGIAQFTTNTNAKFVDVVVTFPKAFASGYIPSISANFRIASIGSAEVAVRVIASTDKNFTARVYTINGTNFESAITNNIYWFAK